MVQVLDVPVPQPMEIQQRTVDDMLQDMVDRVQQRIAPLAELEVVPRPVPPDRTQQRAVQQVGVPAVIVWWIQMLCWYRAQERDS